MRPQTARARRASPATTWKGVCSRTGPRPPGLPWETPPCPSTAPRVPPHDSHPVAGRTAALTGSALPRSLSEVVVLPQSRGTYAVQGCPSVICALPDPRLVLRRPAPRTWSVLRSPRHVGLVVPSAAGCREGTCDGIHAAEPGGHGEGWSGWAAPSDIFCGGSGFLSGWVFFLLFFFFFFIEYM